jgi:hypothetical protein
MTDVVNQSPPDPVLRFRMRTMIAVTSVLAVLAAVAGPYYRSVDHEAGRRSLLIFWSLIVVSSGVSFWLRVKESWRVPKGCHFRYLVYARGRFRKGVWSMLWRILACLLLLAWTALYSHAAEIRSRANIPTSGPTTTVFSSPLFQGVLVGSWTAALIFSFVRRPMFLCEEGIPLGKRFVAPWKYIRHAEWQTDRPETLKLHRLDGDIYVDVPNDVRGGVEAFVRGKTRFVDDAALPPV